MSRCASFGFGRWALAICFTVSFTCPGTHLYAFTMGFMEIFRGLGVAKSNGSIRQRSWHHDGLWISCVFLVRFDTPRGRFPFFSFFLPLLFLYVVLEETSYRGYIYKRSCSIKDFFFLLQKETIMYIRVGHHVRANLPSSPSLSFTTYNADNRVNGGEQEIMIF
jgi:hypothetical protein